MPFLWIVNTGGLFCAVAFLTWNKFYPNSERFPEPPKILLNYEVFSTVETSFLFAPEDWGCLRGYVNYPFFFFFYWFARVLAQQDGFQFLKILIFPGFWP